MHYPSDDEVRQEFSIVYRAEYVSGTPTTSDETAHVEWLPIDQLGALPMDRSQRVSVSAGLSVRSGPWIDPVGD